MKVSILGSSGQIGAYLTDYLTKKGHLVREFDVANDIVPFGSECRVGSIPLKICDRSSTLFVSH